MKALHVGTLLSQRDWHSSWEIPDMYSYTYVALGRNSRCLISVHCTPIDVKKRFMHIYQLTFFIVTHLIQCVVATGWLY